MDATGRRSIPERCGSHFRPLTLGRIKSVLDEMLRNFVVALS
jgi:hypothetical protein